MSFYSAILNQSPSSVSFSNILQFSVNKSSVSQIKFIPKYFVLCVFFFFWLLWVFVAACRLSLVAASGGYSSLQCVGFSMWWLLLLQTMGPRVSKLQQLQCMGSVVVALRLSSCGAQAQLLCSRWDCLRPGIEPVSLALAGRFLTSTPPGKSCFILFDATVNGIVFLVYFLNYLLLVYRNTTNYCLLILYFATLLNLFISYHAFIHGIFKIFYI